MEDYKPESGLKLLGLHFSRSAHKIRGVNRPCRGTARKGDADVRVLLLNGSPHEAGCTCTALGEVGAALEREGVETELVWIGKQPIAGCVACGACGKTGTCVFREDGVNALAARLDTFDGMIVGSPVYYAGPAGQLCCFLDRLFYSAGGKLAGKPGAAVVSCRRGGASAAFDRLNKYFTINNMPLVPSQYWNQVHGTCPEEVLRDEEGMQTMRTLGQNMAWLLRQRQAAGTLGAVPQVYEEKRRTNFIR